MSHSFWEPSKLFKLREGGKLSAAWTQLNSSLSAEILAEAGFDLLVVDMEHAPTQLASLVPIIQATKGTGCLPIVRAPWNDMVVIKQILDVGAYGIHVPYVSTKEEAEFAVKCCKYPPGGIRGIAGSQRAVNYGLNKAEYYAQADDVLVIISIETFEGVRNIRDILEVDGVDGIFIGPADLSTSMGYRANPGVPAVQEAIAAIEEAVLPSKKFLGTVAPDMHKATELYARGYGVVYAASDVSILAQTAKREVALFQGAKWG